MPEGRYRGWWNYIFTERCDQYEMDRARVRGERIDQRYLSSAQHVRDLFQIEDHNRIMYYVYNIMPFKEKKEKPKETEWCHDGE